MTSLVIANLAFATWTVVLLLCSVGVYRWKRILTGKAKLDAFRADQIEGADWYRRAMRAHANCVENLPVLTAIVVSALATGAASSSLATLAVMTVVARVPQSLVHIALPETPFRVGVRFAFYLIQILCLLAMAVLVGAHAL